MYVYIHIYVHIPSTFSNTMAICWFVGPSKFEACRGQTLAQRWPAGHAGGVSLWQLDATWQRLLSGDQFIDLDMVYMVYIWFILIYQLGYFRDDVEKFDTFLNGEHVFAMFIHCRSTLYLV